MSDRPLDDRFSDGRQCETDSVFANEGGYYRFCVYVPAFGVRQCLLGSFSCKYASNRMWNEVTYCKYEVNKK